MLLMNWKEVFPQPVGILPFPFDFLILPYWDRWKEYVDSILILKFEKLPPEWEILSAIKDRNWEVAFQSLSNIQEEDVKNYNLSLLTGQKQVVKDDTLAHLLDVVFSEDFDVKDVGREDIDALILYKKAQTLEKKGKIEDALLMLESALKLVKDVSPVFSTNILLKKVKLLMEHRGINYATVALLEELSERLSRTGADFLKGDVHFNLGNAYSSMGNLQEAIKHYWEALNFFTLDRDPYMYALINNNMGLAYLSTSVSDIEDQVRLAYGVQCLKNALKVFTKEKYPKEWASITMNYANALQYLPTANPSKNLLKAIDLYLEVLNYRKEVKDEIGYARALANMGNALAHLGKLSEAKKHLMEAFDIFNKYGMEEEMTGIREILEEIHTLMEARHDGGA
jgi:tetratricopeptide (TPR) repeat protein